MTIEATAHFTTRDLATAMIIDTKGVFVADLVLDEIEDPVYRMKLTVSPKLAAGKYQGSLQVKVCPVADCSRQFEGSPVYLPYDITVGTPPHLTALKPLVGAEDWLTDQGNPGHTGYVPVTLDPSGFSTRWRWVVPGDTRLTRPVLGGDALAVFWLHDEVHALSEHDASTVWTHRYGSGFPISDLVLSGNSAFYSASRRHRTHLVSLALDTGKTRFDTSSPNASEISAVATPNVFGAAVYGSAASDESGEMRGWPFARYDAASGRTDWLSEWRYQYDDIEPTTAADSKRTYWQFEGRLLALDNATGALVYDVMIPDPPFQPGESSIFPVLTGQASLLMRDRSVEEFWIEDSNKLGLYDTDTGKRLWKADGHFCTDPVVVRNVFYVGNCDGRQFEERNLSNGKILRVWKTPDGAYPANNLVVTRNLLFFGTRESVGAFDLQTGRVAWKFDRPGALAISKQGVLYVTSVFHSTWGELLSPRKSITAFNLH